MTDGEINQDQEKRQPETGEHRKNPGESDHYLIQGLWFILLLVIFFAVMQLYFEVQNIIKIWFSPDYASLISATYFFCIIIVGQYLIWLKLKISNR